MKEAKVFDFDGTLTTCDTFLLFVKYACGFKRFLAGMLLYSPLLVLMKLKLYPNWKAKQRVFSHFLRDCQTASSMRCAEGLPIATGKYFVRKVLVLFSSLCLQARRYI